jgi:TrmH family RNA methyltransferase
MISKNKIKLIHSLEQKKYRKKEGLFVAEGPKIVNELLQSMKCTWLAHIPDYILPLQKAYPIDEVETCTVDELHKTSFLNSPQEVIATFRIPDFSFKKEWISDELCLALDGIQDPGNLGTIIRIADWFGINHIFCSTQTADAFSPKTIQATMGAISRVKVHYTNLVELINDLPQGTPVYGTLLDGNNIYEQELENKGLLIMGNEGNGLTPEIREKLNARLYIPSYPKDSETSESLNVGVATAILCAEFRRRMN